MAKGKKTGGRNFRPGEGGRKPGALGLKTKLRILAEEKERQQEVLNRLKDSMLDASPEIFESLSNKAKNGDRLARREMGHMLDDAGKTRADVTPLVAELIRSMKKNVDFNDYFVLKRAANEIRIEFLESPEILEEFERRLEPFLEFAREQFEWQKEKMEIIRKWKEFISMLFERLSSVPEIKDRLQDFLPAIVQDLEKILGGKASWEIKKDIINVKSA